MFPFFTDFVFFSSEETWWGNSKQVYLMEFKVGCNDYDDDFIIRIRNFEF